MASFTGVGDNVTLNVPAANENILVSISGTYNMTIALQRETGSPGSGSFMELKRWSTANATVAYNYRTVGKDENLRLIVLIDTSGTATATLADDSDLIIYEWRDSVDNVLMQLKQSGVVIYGDLDITGNQLGAAPVNTTAALVLTAADHAGKVVTLNSTTGRAITMPEATGTGDEYTIFVGTTVSSGNHTVIAPSASTSFVGGVSISTDIAGITMLAAAATDTITLNGSTTGGVVGSWLRFTDVASGVFMVEGFLVSTGVEDNPFSAAI